MRTLINKDGITYDPTKNYVFFAEDWNDVVSEIDNLKAAIAVRNSSIVFGRASTGEYVTLNNIQVGISSGGNRSFGIKTVSGTFSAYGESRSVNHNNLVRDVKFEDLGISTSFTYFDSDASLGGVGNTQVVHLQNFDSGALYKITCFVNAGYNGNYIIIEQLFA